MFAKISLCIIFILLIFFYRTHLPGLKLATTITGKPINYAKPPPAHWNRGKYSIFVDYSRSIDSIRFWLISNTSHDTLIKSTCTHGCQSGFLYASDFSNQPESHKSSLGEYIIAEKYIGKFGRSIRLDGISEELNSNARSRNIVIHSTKKLRTRWSWGCFAISESALDAIFNMDLKGSVLYAYK